MTRPKRYALAIELTPHCNQKCAYCYNDWRDEPKAASTLPGPELYALIEKAVTEVAFDHVTLTGGEPFARPEVFDILALLKRHDLRALIISNGGLITDAHAARLAPFEPLFVQVTLNGDTEELHAAHVGDGHWSPTLRGIDALIRHGVEVTGCIVVTRKNAQRVGAILALFQGMGVTSIALSRYSPAGYAAENAAALLPARTDIIAALDLAAPFARDHGMTLQVTMPVPPCVLDTSAYPEISFSACPIGTEMQEFVLGQGGELRNCTLHTESLGDGRTESFAALVDRPVHGGYRDTTPEFCAPCPMKAQCIGGCGAAAATMMGDPRGLDPFVAQHVDDVLQERLRRARDEGEAFVPVGRLTRRTSAERARLGEP